MTDHPVTVETSGWGGPPVGIFWDQSLLWGLICVETLQRLGIPFLLLDSSDISAGRLSEIRVLIVPGGWASHKARQLGASGREAISHFILGGGSYLGFCGGAGLALSKAPSLQLVPIERLQSSQRVPSASGEVWIHGLPGHPAWDGLPQEVPVSVWWPSQFRPSQVSQDCRLATYVSTGQDFCVGDIPVDDIRDEGISWADCEKVYGINLDPGRMMGHPAIVEHHSGNGLLVLSYPHLETPGETWGNRLFSNILRMLDLHAFTHQPGWRHGEPSAAERALTPPGPETAELLDSALRMIEELISFGERHLLWTWRRKWLLRWRRGTRGLEYGSMAVILKMLHDLCYPLRSCSAEPDPYASLAREAKQQVELFCSGAKRLLLEEKLATQTGAVSKLGSVNDSVDKLRAELFGDRMNHGGLCRSVFNTLDTLTIRLIRSAASIGMPMPEIRH